MEEITLTVAILKEIHEELRAARAEHRVEMQASRAEHREEMQASREQLREEMQATRDELRTEMRASRDELRAELQSTREEFSDQLKATREELTERIDRTNTRLDRVVQEQIRQGTTLVEVRVLQERLVDAVVGLDRRQLSIERAMGAAVTEIQRVNARLDHVLTGPLGRYVRGHEARLGDLEQRVDEIELKMR